VTLNGVELLLKDYLDGFVNRVIYRQITCPFEGGYGAIDSWIFPVAISKASVQSS